MRIRRSLTVAALTSLLIGSAAFGSIAAASVPAADPAQATCVVDGVEFLQAELGACPTPLAKVPGVPQSVRARITGPQAIKIRWGAPTGKRAKLYSVYAFVGDQGTLVCTVKRFRCTASDLEVDREYVFYVVAANDAGRGAAGSSAAIYLPAEASPDGFR